VVDKMMTLEEMIDRLSTRVSSALKTSFREFAGVGKSKKVEVILSFLALLELVKQGAISAAQNEHFEDIAIESGEVGVPKYQ
ncbi:MAG TPA: segregation/condensation protein A, partial [Candidatus Paceibacterota bacterium]